MLPPAGRLPQPAEIEPYYDRLRRRVSRALGRGRGRSLATEALLAAPDILMLLARLATDRSVPAASRRLVGGALLYFLLPLDLLPEAFLGLGGLLDDVVLAAAVLAAAFGPELEPHSRGYWSGSPEIARLLRRVAAAADDLLSGGIAARLRRLLKARGVPL